MPNPALFVVTDELQQALERLPKDERRCSSLEPLRVFILRWRREGRTYRRILQILRDDCHIQVAYGTLHEFVQRRSKPRKPKPEPELEQVTPEIAQPKLPEQTAALKPDIRASPAAVAQPRSSLASYRNKPALEPRPPVLKEFHYDESKPLTIDRTIKD